MSTAPAPAPTSSTPVVVIALPGCDTPEAAPVRTERAYALARTIATEEGRITPAAYHGHGLWAVTVHNPDGATYRIQYPVSRFSTVAACGETFDTATDALSHYFTCGECAGASEPPAAPDAVTMLHALGVHEAEHFYPDFALIPYGPDRASAVVVSEDGPTEFTVGVYPDHPADPEPSALYVLPTLAGAALVAQALAGAV